MIWVPFAIYSVAKMTEVVSEAVADLSDDREIRRKAEHVRDISNIVADLSDIAFRIIAKAAPPKPKK